MRYGIITAIMGIALLVGGCPSEEAAATTADRERVRADKTARSIHYLRDTRPEPPICYAYLWGGAASGGPALAVVPCDSVRHLLDNGTPIDYD